MLLTDIPSLPSWHCSSHWDEQWWHSQWWLRHQRPREHTECHGWISHGPDMEGDWGTSGTCLAGYCWREREDMQQYPLSSTIICYVGLQISWGILEDGRSRNHDVIEDEETLMLAYLVMVNKALTIESWRNTSILVRPLGYLPSRFAVLVLPSYACISMGFSILKYTVILEVCLWCMYLLVCKIVCISLWNSVQYKDALYASCTYLSLLLLRRTNSSIIWFAVIIQ